MTLLNRNKEVGTIAAAHSMFRRNSGHPDLTAYGSTPIRDIDKLIQMTKLRFFSYTAVNALPMSLNV